MKTLFSVESVKFSCISLAEKLHVTFDGMKGISRPSLKTNLLNKILARGRVADRCAAKIFLWHNDMFQKEKTRLFSLNGEINQLAIQQNTILIQRCCSSVVFTLHNFSRNGGWEKWLVAMVV